MEQTKMVNLTLRELLKFYKLTQVVSLPAQTLFSVILSVEFIKHAFALILLLMLKSIWVTLDPIKTQ